MCERKTYSFSLHEDEARKIELLAAKCGVSMEDFVSVAVHRYSECVIAARETPPGSGVKISLEQIKERRGG